MYNTVGMDLKYPRRSNRVIGTRRYRLEPPSEKRSGIMSRIPSRGTSIEDLFAGACRRNGIRFRRPRGIVGNPDFRIVGTKILVFCDGDFWHGYRVDELTVTTNSEFWRAKIRRNMERDREVDILLTRRGWTVTRFWEHDLRKNLDSCLSHLREKMLEDEEQHR